MLPQTNIHTEGFWYVFLSLILCPGVYVVYSIIVVLKWLQGYALPTECTQTRVCVCIMCVSVCIMCALLISAHANDPAYCTCTKCDA